MYVEGYSSSNNYKPDVSLSGSYTPEIKKTYLILKNLLDKDVYPFAINGYTLISNAGTNVNKTGYTVNIGFYDENLEEEFPENKYINYDIESLTSKEIFSGLILQKGRGQDDELLLPGGVFPVFPDLKPDFPTCIITGTNCPL